MTIKYDSCVGGPVIEYEVINEDTLQIDGVPYFFDPDLIEYESIRYPAKDIIFIAYNIFRDDVTNELKITLFQGIHAGTNKEVVQ